MSPHSPSNSVNVSTRILFGLKIVPYSVVTGNHSSPTLPRAKISLHVDLAANGVDARTSGRTARGRRNWPQQDVNHLSPSTTRASPVSTLSRPPATQEHLCYSHRSISPVVAFAPESSHLLRLLPLKGCVAGVFRTSDCINPLAITS